MQKILAIVFCLMSLHLTAKNTITYVSLERTPCFGRCGAYIVEFKSNGEVTYTGKANVKMMGVYKAKMTKSQMSVFLRRFEKYKFAGLQNRYETKVVDAPGMNMAIRVNGKLKSVKHAEAGPRFLTQIGADIDEKVKDLKWKPVEPLVYDEPPVAVAVEEVSNPEPDVFEYVEQMPQFPGGEAALKNYLNTNIKYPDLARENGVEGKVFCRFIVDKTGAIKNAEVVRGIAYGCDDEAIRVINAMPNWIPGKQNGKHVAVKFILPVFFKLQ